MNDDFGKHFEARPYDVKISGKPVTIEIIDPPVHPFWHGVAILSASIVAIAIIAWVFNEWVTQ